MISIIPKPLELNEQSGHFVITNGTTIGGAFPHAADKCREIFAKAGIILQPKWTDIVIKLEESGSEEIDIEFVLDESQPEEGYVMEVESDGITIAASTDKGAFYAVQTLRQACLVDTMSDVSEVTVPNFEVVDKPRFAHRGFMLDVARHFFGTEVIKQYLDMLALNKMNIFHWHLTDDQGWRIEIKKYPELAKHGAKRSSTQMNLIGYNKGTEKHNNNPYGEGLYFTQEEVRDIVAYAADLHINVIPEIDMPGHLVAAISCFPELSCEGKPIDVSTRWGILDTIGCVGGDKLMPFIKDVIDELCDLFPYNYIHIGGDEVPKKKWEKCPKCQAKIKELGLKNEEDLQGWFNNQVLEYLAGKGKHIVGWNELLEAESLADETIIQWWIHGAAKAGVDKWVAKGNKVVMSPHAYIYMDHFYSWKDLKKTYSIDLDTMQLDMIYESNVLGIEGPMWTEYVRDVDKLHFNTFPRLQAIAEINWTSRENKDFDDFEVRLRSTEMPIMDKLGINYAPREAYLCRGFKGWLRFVKDQTNWLKDAYTEFDKYSRKKR